ncbi:hypothetical protein P7K49_026065 [Saguinus oedipus]|uniref:Uncharacterized protein n=1 Tax=Saguinus oedipus TaxID=9490 RepID=A0ABQ9UIY3_SAGOE|nr:hypothetical protein P7K49_026065 [Saguinus oedipus]
MKDARPNAENQGTDGKSKSPEHFSLRFSTNSSLTVFALFNSEALMESPKQALHHVKWEVPCGKGTLTTGSSRPRGDPATGAVWMAPGGR